MIDLGNLGLGKGDLVLLDSGPLIYLAGDGMRESAGQRSRVVGAFVTAAKSAGAVLVASTLAWTEVLRGPLASGDEGAASACRRMLAGGGLVRLEPLDAAMAEEAAGIMAGGRVELADAVHLATALVLGVRAILTNDEAWTAWIAARAGAMEKGGRGLPRVLLVDELAFDLDD